MAVSNTTAYSRMTAGRQRQLTMMVCVLAVLTIIDLLVGPAMLNVFDVLAALFATNDAVDPTTIVIVRDIRLPMTVMAAIVGASLGIAGSQMQTILGNPLASPYTLGFSAAAGFGAAAAILPVCNCHSCRR
jgi:iron complex transport system permease protein